MLTPRSSHAWTSSNPKAWLSPLSPSLNSTRECIIRATPQVMSRTSTTFCVVSPYLVSTRPLSKSSAENAVVSEPQAPSSVTSTCLLLPLLYIRILPSSPNNAVTLSELTGCGWSRYSAFCVILLRQSRIKDMRRDGLYAQSLVDLRVPRIVEPCHHARHTEDVARQDARGPESVTAR